jgi:hypothetical protein
MSCYKQRQGLEVMQEAFKRFQKTDTRQGQRIFALGFLATMKQQGALRLVWLNIKQMIERLTEGDKP